MRNPRLEGVCRAERRKEAENGFKSGGKQPRVLKEGAHIKVGNSCVSVGSWSNT